MRKHCQQSPVNAALLPQATSTGGAQHRSQFGFSLIELMITVVIVSILAAIAIPSYSNSVTKSRRRAAEACLSIYVQYMERFYTANMRYDKRVDSTDNTLPAFDCASNQNTGNDYTYSFPSGSPTRSTYVVQAVPKGNQATRDTACGTLTLNQAGTRGANGSTAAANVSKCW
ncbi:type IV pilin protein [Stagnimonas aquatica]|uniref:Type IV pilin protein n=1 Tax=Stagnimonas aquatica TaxID=2689987 RepID=A0A3N0V9Y0_9GAMM|nr:type IV pilin protein [Stagnimonas aquatica]